MGTTYLMYSHVGFSGHVTSFSLCTDVSNYGFKEAMAVTYFLRLPVRLKLNYVKHIFTHTHAHSHARVHTNTQTSRPYHQ